MRSTAISERGPHGRTGRARLTALLLALAGLWGCALLALAGLFHLAGQAVVGETAAGRSFTLHAPARSLVQTDGRLVLLPLALPLLAVLIVSWSLHHRRARGLGPGPLALGATGVIGALSILGILSVGPFLLPVAALSAAACALSQPVPPLAMRQVEVPVVGT